MMFASTCLVYFQSLKGFLTRRAIRQLIAVAAPCKDMGTLTATCDSDRIIACKVDVELGPLTFRGLVGCDAAPPTSAGHAGTILRLGCGYTCRV